MYLDSDTTPHDSDLPSPPTIPAPDVTAANEVNDNGDSNNASETPSRRLYESRQTPHRGVGLFALKDIRAGTVIIREFPVFTVLDDDDDLRVLTKFKLISSDMRESFLTLQAGHCLPTRVTLFDDLEWMMRLSQGPLWTQLQKQYFVQAWLANYALIDTMDMRILGVLRNNSRILRDGRSAVYVKSSRLNHSCRPNCRDTEEMNGLSMRIEAVKDIPCGEELLIGYRDFRFTTRQNRFKELRQWAFVCTCDACCDVTGYSDARRVLMGTLRMRLDIRGFHYGAPFPYKERGTVDFRAINAKLRDDELHRSGTNRDVGFDACRLLQLTWKEGLVDEELENA